MFAEDDMFMPISSLKMKTHAQMVKGRLKGVRQCDDAWEEEDHYTRSRGERKCWRRASNAYHPTQISLAS